VPHLGSGKSNATAVVRGHLVGDHVAVALYGHLLRLVGEQLHNAAQPAIHEHKSVAAEHQVHDHLLDELEAGLPVVGRVPEQAVQRVVVGRSTHAAL